MHPSSAPTRALLGVLALALVTACGGQPENQGNQGFQAQTQPGGALPTFAVSDLPPLPALRTPPMRPDVLVTGRLTTRQVAAVAKVAPSAVTYRTGTVTIGRTAVQVAVVDPLRFRRYAPVGTAESTPVWQTVAANQLVASHEIAKRLKLPLGGTVVVTKPNSASIRLGALATTGIPSTDLLMSTAVAEVLGIAGPTAVVVHAGKVDPTRVAAKVRDAAGAAADVSLLSPPLGNPTAFLTGSRAARAFGAFSYRYYSDGTIEPDARWVRANIVSARVPILGVVTCHRLMIPQLREALREVERAGLGSKIHSYDGCYVPRFIERDPSRSVSLHTWGIAIDLDASTNGRGIRGTMDDRIVTIFKRWGFRWGGDWTYTDPMHFELGALLRTSR